jgi:hypothetical protein
MPAYRQRRRSSRHRSYLAAITTESVAVLGCLGLAFWVSSSSPQTEGERISVRPGTTPRLPPSTWPSGSVDGNRDRLREFPGPLAKIRWSPYE